MSYRRQYSDAMLDGMQAAYGTGYLSPGGAEEVFRILQGIAVRDTRVLDLGCGVGGASLLIADTLKAGAVTGVDVERENIRRANIALDNSVPDARVEFELIEPGTLPFDDASFDIVFTKDVLCHVEDKPALFAEVKRVLRPGGAFCSGDWQRQVDHEPLPLFDDWLRALNEGGLSFCFESAAAYVRYMEQVGFRDVSSQDVSQWLLALTRDELEQTLIKQQAALAQELGAQGFDRRIELTRIRLRGLEAGAIQHWHYQAFA